MAIGSPLWPIFANFFMGDQESKLVDEYIRSRDDCLVISQSGKTNEFFFRKSNASHYKISFTKEMEINSKIHFLDILIKKSKDGFLTSL